MMAYGTQNQPLGTWSDDSSLPLCLAEALTKEFDLQNIGNNFISWLKNNYWTALGNIFDVGNATRHAFEQLRRGVQPELAGGTSDNGNGSLMRILPLLDYISSCSRSIPKNHHFHFT
jgi:ADP-ribosylglycohydrolase